MGVKAETSFPSRLIVGAEQRPYSDTVCFLLPYGEHRGG